jgi:lipoprotein signal peptidase
MPTNGPSLTKRALLFAGILITCIGVDVLVKHFYVSEHVGSVQYHEKTTPLVILALFLFLAAFTIWRARYSFLLILGFATMLAGGIGNWLSRGHVPDMFMVPNWWPINHAAYIFPQQGYVFNTADLFIWIGLTVLLLTLAARGLRSVTVFVRQRSKTQSTSLLSN